MSAGSHFVSRFIPSLIGLVVFATVVGLFLSGDEDTYNRLLTLWGMVPYRFPFLDLDGALAAWDCSRQGIDVILADPCDVLKRGYNYAPLWMSIDWIPLGRPDRVVSGLVLDVAFLTSLTILPPPLTRTETLLRVAAVLSTMVVFALERGNPDLLIFLLALAMLRLLRGPLPARLCGYGIGFLAGAIKYYPFILFGLAARERMRIVLLTALAAAAGFFLFVAFYFKQIAEGLPHIASGGPFTDMFGARNVPMGVFLIVRHLLDSSAGTKVTIIDRNFIILGVVALIITAVWITLVVRGAAAVWRTSDVSSALQRLDEPRRLALLAGALLLTGCFITGQSIGYRGVFLFLVLPGLYAVGRDTQAGTLAGVARVAAMILPPLMWAEGIRLWLHLAVAGELPPSHFVKVLGQPLDTLAWFARESGWWFLIALLSIFLLGFLKESPLVGYCRQHLPAGRRP